MEPNLKKPKIMFSDKEKRLGTNIFAVLKENMKIIAKAQEEKKVNKNIQEITCQTKRNKNSVNKRKREVMETIKKEFQSSQEVAEFEEEHKNIEIIESNKKASHVHIIKDLEETSNSFSKLSLDAIERKTQFQKEIPNVHQMPNSTDAIPLPSADQAANLQPKLYKAYSLDFKVSFIQTYLQHGLSMACIIKKLDSSTASKWVRKFKDFGYAGLEDKRKMNGAKPNDQLEKFVLSKFIEKRTKGITVNYKILQNIALSAPKHIIPANFQASLGWIQNFLKRNNISRRRKTHAAQELITSITKSVLDYFDELQGIHSWKDSKITFLNLDEIPLFFDLSNDYTLHFKGEHEVKILSHSAAKSRATFMPCLTSEGEFLPPLFIFIYKYGEQSTRDFPIKYDHLRNQTSPFMIRFTGSGSNNEMIFTEYIRKVLKPWRERKDVHPVLILDEATCHLTQNVMNTLKEAKILPLYIPGGATSILQPLDVMINKSIKSSIRESYQAWLENQVKKTEASLIPPSVEDIIDWSQVSLSLVPKEQLVDSFIVTGISQELPQLKDGTLLHSKLSTLFDEHLEKIGNPRELLEDVNQFYLDSIDLKIQEITLEQEFDLPKEN